MSEWEYYTSKLPLSYWSWQQKKASYKEGDSNLSLHMSWGEVKGAYVVYKGRRFSWFTSVQE